MSDDKKSNDGSIRFGLWLKESKKGTKYMSGKVKEAIPAGSWVNVFKNTRKQTGQDNFPDYNVIVNLPEPAGPNAGKPVTGDPKEDSIPF